MIVILESYFIVCISNNIICVEHNVCSLSECAVVLFSKHVTKKKKHLKRLNGKIELINNKYRSDSLQPIENGTFLYEIYNLLCATWQLLVYSYWHDVIVYYTKLIFYDWRYSQKSIENINHINDNVYLLEKANNDKHFYLYFSLHEILCRTIQKIVYHNIWFYFWCILSIVWTFSNDFQSAT